MHEVRARANRDQTGQRAVVHEARIVTAEDQRGERATGHRHQRIHRHQSADLVNGLRRHHVKTKPADGQYPRAQCQKWNTRRWMRTNAAIFRIAAATRAQQQHRHQSDPAAHRMHHHRTGKVVKVFTRRRLDPGLHAVVFIPRDTLEKRIHETNDQKSRGNLRIEFGPFSDTARNNRRHCSGEGQQEEKFHQLETAFLDKLVRTAHEINSISDTVTDEKISNRRD